MQQRYLVPCYKSGKVQLYLQGSAEVVSHQHCCLLQPAVTLVILCPSSSDRSQSRRPSLRYICLRHMSFATKESLHSLQFPVVCRLYWLDGSSLPISLLQFVSHSSEELRSDYVFSLTRRISLCDICIIQIWHEALEIVWSSYGFISPQSKNVIHLTYFILAVRWITAEKHLFVFAEYKK